MHALSETKAIQLSDGHKLTFRSQRGIQEVTKEMCFDEDVSLKFACLAAGEGERCSIISEGQLKFHFPKIYENFDCPQGINHSMFHYWV